MRTQGSELFADYRAAADTEACLMDPHPTRPDGYDTNTDDEDEDAI